MSLCSSLPEQEAGLAQDMNRHLGPGLPFLGLSRIGRLAGAVEWRTGGHKHKLQWRARPGEVGP